MEPQLQTLQHTLEAAAQRADAEGIEFWFARDLQAPLGYARWENFQTAIQRAMESCEAGDRLRESEKALSQNIFPAHLDHCLKNLATEMTNHNVAQANLQGERAITDEHVQNNVSVRDKLGQRGMSTMSFDSLEAVAAHLRQTLEENKNYFRTIFSDFMANYRFNPELFAEAELAKA